jgi:hypothetical protein
MNPGVHVVLKDPGAPDRGAGGDYVTEVRFSGLAALRPPAADVPDRAARIPVSETAGALGLSSPAPGAPPGSSIPSASSVPSGSQPTISAPLGAAGPRAAPGGYPPGAAPGSFPSAGQVPPRGPYPAAPPPLGNAPGGYRAASGYPSAPVPGYGPQPPASGFVPVARTNGLAIASLVLGILWLFWLGSVVGLVLGLVALKQIRTRNQGGRGIAIAGIVLSVLWLLVLIVTIIAGVAKGS